MRAFFAALVVLLAAVPAFAVNPDEILADPALEARLRVGAPQPAQKPVAAE